MSTLSWRLTESWYFDDRRVKNSVLNTVSRTLSYSPGIWRIMKSSWSGLETKIGINRIREMINWNWNIVNIWTLDGTLVSFLIRLSGCHATLFLLLGGGRGEVRRATSQCKVAKDINGREACLSLLNHWLSWLDISQLHLPKWHRSYAFHFQFPFYNFINFTLFGSFLHLKVPS